MNWDRYNFKALLKLGNTKPLTSFNKALKLALASDWRSYELRSAGAYMINGVRSTAPTRVYCYYVTYTHLMQRKGSTDWYAPPRFLALITWYSTHIFTKFLVGASKLVFEFSHPFKLYLL